MEFLGWFEESETLYIAMEYLKEGDLAEHIDPLAPLPQETAKTISRQILEGLKVMHQEGITHRDIKPAVLSFPPSASLCHAPLHNTDESKNILVVSMSPVWVKIADFGVSKWIQAPDTTTLHTQVSTLSYGAPEVLGLNSNSETSDYTNSVDIWSLGCVTYELFAGTKLFTQEFPLYRYFFGNPPFPEERLKELSPPIDDAGITLLKAMLAIKPGERPTAADALSHRWLAGLKCSSDECSEEDGGGTTPNRNESTPSRKRKNRPAPHDRQENRRTKRDRPTLDDTERIPGDVGSRMNPRSQRDGEFTPRKLC